MERFLGWRGLLIEADPSNFQLLLKKHRRAWAVHACLSGNTVSQVLTSPSLWGGTRVAEQAAMAEVNVVNLVRAVKFVTRSTSVFW